MTYLLKKIFIDKQRHYGGSGCRLVSCGEAILAQPYSHVSRMCQNSNLGFLRGQDLTSGIFQDRCLFGWIRKGGGQYGKFLFIKLLVFGVVRLFRSHSQRSFDALSCQAVLSQKQVRQNGRANKVKT